MGNSELNLRSHDQPGGADGVVSVRHAATVLVVRHHPLQVLMLRRSLQATFLPGAYVFPGGVVDPADAHLAPHLLHGDRSPDGEDLDHAARIAAIRECFEEAGLLVGLAPGTDHLRPERVAQARADLLDGRATFADVLGQLQVRLQPDALLPLARWVTPTGSPRRYDTRFYVVSEPPGTLAAHDNREVIASRWFDPLEALEAGERGEVMVITPTKSSLQFLSRFASAAEVFGHLEGRPSSRRD
jgi:8-oxo-dGTP pyrophosphatase MutT (NUDIX family)